ncbi:MAG: hypothetical protein QM627_03955 [Luteolibacter sp.]
MSTFVLLIIVIVTWTSGESTESLADVKARTVELEKQRIAAEQEAKRRSAITRIEGLENQLSILGQSLAATQVEKDAHATKMKDYAMDHKMAIAAMGIAAGSGAVALSDKSSDDEKTVAGIGAAAAGIYVLANASECAEVADRISKAKAMEADYDAKISKTKSTISSLQSRIDKEKADLQW